MSSDATGTLQRTVRRKAWRKQRWLKLAGKTVDRNGTVFKVESADADHVVVINPDGDPRHKLRMKTRAFLSRHVEVLDGDEG